jgi:type I restriction enzyme M protein
MGSDSMKDIQKLESDLWEAADNLRANSKLNSSDYFMPVLGVIFLRHANNRFEAAQKQIERDQETGKMPKRKLLPADFVARRSLYLPENARYEWIMQQASLGGADLPKLMNEAMISIEGSFEPLQGVLPKEYGIFEPKVLEDLLRSFNSEQIKQATGDVFGRIYEYFLAKFSMQKAHDNGEFFTPSSLVQTIVNVIEPDHGIVFDPACGSGGMFVQSSHFIEQEGLDTAKRVVFYGHEKDRTTTRLAIMNLAVHGLDGKISGETISYYDDPYNLAGKCDFVMANPPFNVDLVDAERVKGDPRLPFGLPGVNKDKKVSNGNYLWISYFWSYLNEKGRAGFVMSSQASSAGGQEKEVRRKLVETGGVDLMVDIRSNFFYTRTVPCQLWFLDKNKSEDRKDTVLMLDARNIYRKVTRKIYDFSPEQMLNLSAIIWLYRGEAKRFLAVVNRYLEFTCEYSSSIDRTLKDFEGALNGFTSELPAQDSSSSKDDGSDLSSEIESYTGEKTTLVREVKEFKETLAKRPPTTNDVQHAARKQFDSVADRIKKVIKQVDHIYKIAARNSAEQSKENGNGSSRGAGKLIKQLDEARRNAVRQLKETNYFYRQVCWLQDRFPEAQFRDVLGLVKAVRKKNIADADWSLTPGRYVGVAPAEVDYEFDFEQLISEIRSELSELNSEAISLARNIDDCFNELSL